MNESEAHATIWRNIRNNFEAIQQVLKEYLIAIYKGQSHAKPNNIFSNLNIQGWTIRKGKRTINPKFISTALKRQRRMSTQMTSKMLMIFKTTLRWRHTGLVQFLFLTPYTLFLNFLLCLLNISKLPKSGGLQPRSSHWTGRPSLTWLNPSPLWPGHLAHSLAFAATLVSTRPPPLHLDPLGSPCQESFSETHMAQALPSFRPPLRRHVLSLASWPLLLTLCSPAHWSLWHWAPPSPDHWHGRL